MRPRATGSQLRGRRTEVEGQPLRNSIGVFELG